jgi:hypothetical protein
MSSLWIALLSFGGFIAAYRLYGRYLGRRIFGIDPRAVCPSRRFEDGIDYVPMRRLVLFGHHYTSIAGASPIIGPAIALFWGWLPALLWVVVGSIFAGAVHDFGALVVVSPGHDGRLHRRADGVCAVHDELGDVAQPEGVRGRVELAPGRRGGCGVRARAVHHRLRHRRACPGQGPARGTGVRAGPLTGGYHEVFCLTRRGPLG